MINNLYIKSMPTLWNFNLMAVIMANYMNHARIYDALLFIIENPNLPRLLKKHNKFPLRAAYMYPSILTNYEEVYKQTSLRILTLVSKLIVEFHTFFLS